MQKKDLHMGSSLKDLDEYYSVDWDKLKDKSLTTILNSLAKIREAGHKARLDGDEEKAYVLFMKFMNILSKIQTKKPDFQKEKQLTTKIIGGNAEMKKLYKLVEEITTSLEERYKQKAALEMKPFEASEISSDPEPEEPSVPETISCIELNSLIENGEKVLILDCRPDSDYEQSRMTYKYTINIPERLCTLAMTSGKIQNQLPNESKVFWELRKNRSSIIFVDWSSLRYNRNSPVWHLRDSLLVWDQDTQIQEISMRLLEGGYERWKTTYPMKCLNPNYEPPNPRQDTSVLEIEYPNLEDIEMKNTTIPQIDRSSKYVAMKAYEKTKDELLDENKKLLDTSLKMEKHLLELETEYKDFSSNKENTEDSESLEQSKLYEIYELTSKLNDQKTKVQEIKKQLEISNEVEPATSITKTAQVEAEIKVKELEFQRLRENRELKRLEREKALELSRERKPQSFSYATPPKAMRNELILSPKMLSNQVSDQKIPTFDRSSKPVYNVTRFEFNEQDFSPVYGKTVSNYERKKKKINQ